MADLPTQLFPSDLIAEAIRQIMNKLKQVDARFAEADTLDDLESGEPGMEASFSNPVFSSQNNFFNVRVSSVSTASFYGIRLIPSTDTTSPWKDDSNFSTKSIQAFCPTGVVVPPLNQVVLVHFTGLTSGASRYGLFTAPGTMRYKVMSVGENTLTCRLLSSAGSELGTNITVARPQELRKSTYHGLTINGVTYTHLSTDQRSGTNGTTVETQVVIPPYVATVSKILVGIVPNEDSSLGVYGTDLNEAGRAWSKTS